MLEATEHYNTEHVHLIWRGIGPVMKRLRPDETREEALARMQIDDDCEIYELRLIGGGKTGVRGT